MNNVGRLIRFHRIKKGYSQEYLAHGICVVSYLSKIENGNVDAAEEIKNAILKKLDVKYENNDYHKQLLDNYFNEHFIKMKENRYREELISLKDDIYQSVLVLYYRLFELYEFWQSREDEQAYKIFVELTKMQKAMSEHEQFYFYLVAIKFSQDITNAENYFKKAYSIYDVSPIYSVMANRFIEEGYLQKAIDVAQKGYSKASEEGYVLTMFSLSLSIANSYSGLSNKELMEKYYNRTANLAKVIEGTNGIIEYNLGASLIEHKKYEEAQKYLLMALNNCSNHVNKFYIYHKLAWINIEMDDMTQTEIYINHLMEIASSNKLNNTETMLYEILVAYHKNDESLQIKLERLIQDKNVFEGFRRFHMNVLSDIYTKKRKYKEAYELLMQFRNNS